MTSHTPQSNSLHPSPTKVQMSTNEHMEQITIRKRPRSEAVITQRKFFKKTARGKVIKGQHQLLKQLFDLIVYQSFVNDIFGTTLLVASGTVLRVTRHSKMPSLWLELPTLCFLMAISFYRTRTCFYHRCVSLPTHKAGLVSNSRRWSDGPCRITIVLPSNYFVANCHGGSPTPITPIV